MKKKKVRVWLSALLAVLVLACAFAILKYGIPYLEYIKETKRLDKYSAKKCESSFTRVTKRIELSREEYEALKEELLSEGWSDATENIYGEIDELSRSYFTDEERTGDREKLIRIKKNVINLPAMDRPCIFEELFVVIKDDKVYLQFDVFISSGDIKL